MWLRPQTATLRSGTSSEAMQTVPQVTAWPQCARCKRILQAKPRREAVCWLVSVLLSPSNMQADQALPRGTSQGATDRHCAHSLPRRQGPCSGGLCTSLWQGAGNAVRPRVQSNAFGVKSMRIFMISPDKSLSMSRRSHYQA